MLRSLRKSPGLPDRVLFHPSANAAIRRHGDLSVIIQENGTRHLLLNYFTFCALTPRWFPLFQWFPTSNFPPLTSQKAGSPYHGNFSSLCLCRHAAAWCLPYSKWPRFKLPGYHFFQVSSKFFGKVASFQGEFHRGLEVSEFVTHVVAAAVEDVAVYGILSGQLF